MPGLVDPEVRRQLRTLVLDRLGFAPSAAHEYRVDNAIERLLEDGEAPAATAALETPAWQRVIDALVVGETHFFRQPAWFAQLEEHVLKPLIATRLRTGTKRLRLWSAACATGEEAYTLAIMVDRLLTARADWDIRITGTDINARFLADARRATYREWSLREVEPALRARYFRDLGTGRCELAPAIRDMVSFRLLDLLEPAEPYEDVDLVVCRNMLMYLTPERQAGVAHRLAAAVAPDGWLAVAPAEAAAEVFRPLVPFNVPSAIFFHHAVAASAPPPAAPRRERRPAVKRATVRPKPSVKAAAPAGGFERIRALADRGDLGAARGECETLLAGDSLSYAGNLLLALICEAQGDLAAALAAAKHAAYIEPGSAPAHFLCGIALARFGRTHESHRKMEIVLQLLAAAAPAPCAVWDVSAEALRGAAGEALAGVMFANVRSTVG
jgi:chemotaxis protein methyltransferase CheR